MLRIEYIESDKDNHFTGALTTNSMEVESLSFPSDWSTTERHECIIEGITLQSDQNLEWDVFIWAKSTAEDTSDIDLDEYLDFFNFVKTTGKQIAGSNQYYYPSLSNNVRVPYRDKDLSSKIHVGLVNRSATAKLAGATGEVKIRIVVRPIID